MPPTALSGRWEVASYTHTRTSPIFRTGSSAARWSLIRTPRQTQIATLVRCGPDRCYCRYTTCHCSRLTCQLLHEAREQLRHAELAHQLNVFLCDVDFCLNALSGAGVRFKCDKHISWTHLKAQFFAAVIQGIAFVGLLSSGLVHFAYMNVFRAT